MIEVIKFTNEEDWLRNRTKDITSTEVSALFDASPYMTKFELYHQKKSGEVVKIEQSDRMKWGTRLQDSIAEGIAKDHDLNITKMTEYMRDPELRMGSSFDFGIGNDGLLEIKTVDAYIFKNQWTEHEDGSIEAPAHIEFQIQHQLAVSGRKYAFLGVLVGGNKVVVSRRERNEKVIDAIRKAVKNFWHDVDNDIVPPINFEKDADFIAHLHSVSESEAVKMEATQELIDLADEYMNLGIKISDFKSRQDEIKAQMMTMVGSAEKIVGPTFSISAGWTKPVHVKASVREPRREFVIRFKKEKS